MDAGGRRQIIDLAAVKLADRFDIGIVVALGFRKFLDDVLKCDLASIEYFDTLSFRPLV